VTKGLIDDLGRPVVRAKSRATEGGEGGLQKGAVPGFGKGGGGSMTEMTAPLSLKGYCLISPSS
jgi:hypothetical protein